MAYLAGLVESFESSVQAFPRCGVRADMFVCCRIVPRYGALDTLRRRCDPCFVNVCVKIVVSGMRSG